MAASFQEFAGQRNGRDITRMWVEVLGDYMPTQNEFLLEKGGGNVKVFQPILENPRIRSAYIQRFSGLTSKELEVVPGGDKKIDRLAAEHIQHQLENNLDWDAVTEQMMYAVHNGYSIAEMMYGREDGKVILADIKVRDPYRFHFGSDMLPRLKTFGKPTGEPLPPQKFWHLCYGSTHGDEPYGRGLGSSLYWIDWFQRNLKKWQITYLENYADPSTIGHYPIGATDAQKKTLQGAVQNIGKTKWATLPEGMLIELLEASRAGNADYQSFHDSLDTAASTLILGQNMTSESGSSEAQANVHMDVGDRIIESDDALISSSFNAGVVTWLTNWNFPGAAIPRVRRKLEPPEDLKATADRDKIVVDMGFPLDPEYVVKTYGDGFKAVETDTAQTSLNGAQLQAFVSLVTSAQMGGWSPEMVKTALLISFPHVPEKLIEQMAKTMRGMKPVDPNAAPVDPNASQPVAPNPTQLQPQPSLDDVAAQFTEALDEVALQFEVEFKLKEGSTKEVNGKQYILTNSRWRRADVAPKTEKKPKSATSKPLTETQKKKKEKVLKDASVEVKSKKSLSKVITDAISSEDSKPNKQKPNANPEGLVLVPKEKEKEKEDPKIKKTTQEQINDKYSSENPTDDDVKSWLADTIETRNNPTPQNVESRTAAEMARRNRRYESGVDTDKFSSKIVDRKSYALAAQAAEQWEKRRYPDLVERRTDPAVWLESRMSRGDGLRVTQIPALEKKLATSKSDAVKKTVAKQLASLKEDVRRKPEVREQAQRDAAKWQAIYSSSKVDRVKQLEKDFDAESAKTKIEMEATYADIKKGKKSALEDATNDAGRVGNVKRYPGSKPGTNRPISNEDIKDRLKEMGAAKSDKMFSVGKGTTKADIRQQYRALAGIHHPDKGGDPVKFRSLNDAYNKIMEKLN